MQTIEEILIRWDSNDGKPYKGMLIDVEAYKDDPNNIGCMCAQGQVLHLLGGWTPETLLSVEQHKADLETAKLLNISVAHAVLLRYVNDSVDGAPSIVLTHPERILGDQAHTVLAFWKHLDRMSEADWRKTFAAGDAARDAAGAAAWAAAGDAARDAAGDAARATARDAAWDAAQAAAWAVARDAAWAAAGAVARDAAWFAAWASNEIQAAQLMRERGNPFFFLSMFGFASPDEIPLIHDVSALEVVKMTTEEADDIVTN